MYVYLFLNVRCVVVYGSCVYDHRLFFVVDRLGVCLFHAPEYLEIFFTFSVGRYQLSIRDKTITVRALAQRLIGAGVRRLVLCGLRHARAFIINTASPDILWLFSSS